MGRRREIIVAILRWLATQPTSAAEIPNELAACPDVPLSILHYHVAWCEEAGFIRRMQNHWYRFTRTGHDELEKPH